MVFHHSAFDQLSNQSLLQIQVEKKTDHEKDHWITGGLPLSSTLNCRRNLFAASHGNTLKSRNHVSIQAHKKEMMGSPEPVYIYIYIHIHTHTYIHTRWRRAWQPTPVFSPGEFHQLRSLAGYSPMEWQSQTQLSNSAQHINIERVRTGWHRLLL